MFKTIIFLCSKLAYFHFLVVQHSNNMDMNAHGEMENIKILVVHSKP